MKIVVVSDRSAKPLEVHSAWIKGHVDQPTALEYAHYVTDIHRPPYYLEYIKETDTLVIVMGSGE